MRQLTLISLLILLQIISFGQLKKVDLAKVSTISQAEEFIESNPKSEGKLFSIKPDEDLAEISPTVFTKAAGYTFEVGDYTYKVMDVDSLRSFRVSYIYLDGTKYSKFEIDQIRQKIIAQYKTGVKFTDLVKKYNMDGNTTGDTKWFTEKAMVEEFEKAVKSHKKGEIFTVDTPNQNWYHVVLKTYNDTYVKKLTLLKVKSSS